MFYITVITTEVTRKQLNSMPISNATDLDGVTVNLLKTTGPAAKDQ